MKKLVSIIIPAKDEEETIGTLLIDLNKTIKTLNNYNFEIIVVNDRSNDKTRELAEKAGAKVVNNINKSGKGNALVTGFREASGDYIVMMDADCSHIPSELPIFLDSLDKEKDVGLVVGSRILGGSEEYNLIRAFGNVLITSFFKFLFKIPTTDIINGYKAFKKEVINHNFNSRHFEIEIELVATALRKGMKIKEVRSHERARAGGKMKSFALKHGMLFLTKILTERFRRE